MKQVQQHMMMHQQQQQQQMHEPPSAPLLLLQPPPIKRPRVDVATSTAAGPAIAVPMKVVGHYSFAAASASTSTFQRHPGSLGVGGGGGVGGGRPSSGGSGGIPLTFSSSATHPTTQAVSRSHDAAATTRPKSSQASQDRRRERNRILARRTRLRKKFFFESLQKDVSDLQRENATLKGIVRNRLPIDDANILLEGCDANERLPVIDLLGCGGEGEDGDGLAALFPPSSGGRGDDETTSSLGRGGGERDVTKLDRDDYSLIRSIQNSQHCFIITDPSLHDNPIVYASDDFLSLTGYSQSDVLGRNCRFLQGSETHSSKVKMIRDAVESGEDCSVVLVNYTSDGEPFWNSLFIAALRDADSNIVNFIGVIVKVAGPEPGDIEYGKVLKE
jgi:PAS domain S-box-containing protein